ncbi:hypothetical protein, partial [Streptomyces anulatus]|uniref:hypothetical protein n=1 Tax=Streptomyces anulatus TaxID=1892 RepID=UPI0036885BE3
HHREGPRWADLRDARGEVDGRALVSLLPTWCAVPVLSAHRTDPVEAPAGGSSAGTGGESGQPVG